MQNYLFSYSYPKNTTKFLDQFHNYISKVLNVSEFYIVNDIKCTFYFNIALSVNQQTLLNTTISSYVPPLTYLKVTTIESVNILNSKINSTIYVPIATWIYNINNYDSTEKLDNISIISSISGVSTYQIRIFDTTNNTVLYESGLLNNITDQLINLSGLQNIPKINTSIEVQVKVTLTKFTASFSAINFTFSKVIQ